MLAVTFHSVGHIYGNIVEPVRITVTSGLRPPQPLDTEEAVHLDEAVVHLAEEVVHLAEEVFHPALL